MGAQPSAPSAPSIPPFNFEEAKKIVDEAYKQQQIVTKKLEEKAIPYEEKREVAQAELGSLFGRTGPEAVSAYERRFETGMPGIKQEFETKQKTFQPGLLDPNQPGSSFNLLTNVLRSGAQEFTGGLNQAADRSTARLYQTLAMPVMGFEQIANRPSLNKLYDATYMEFAKKPPTVNSDVESFKNLYTYNV